MFSLPQFGFVFTPLALLSWIRQHDNMLFMQIIPNDKVHLNWRVSTTGQSQRLIQGLMGEMSISLTSHRDSAAQSQDKILLFLHTAVELNSLAQVLEAKKQKTATWSAALLSISQFIQSALPVTSSHFITAPDVYLLAVHSLCSVLQVCALKESSNVDLPYAFRSPKLALCTTHYSHSQPEWSICISGSEKRRGGTGAVNHHRNTAR